MERRSFPVALHLYPKPSGLWQFETAESFADLTAGNFLVVQQHPEFLAVIVGRPKDEVAVDRWRADNQAAVVALGRVEVIGIGVNLIDHAVPVPKLGVNFAPNPTVEAVGGHAVPVDALKSECIDRHVFAG